MAMSIGQIGHAVKRLQVKHHRAATEALRPLGVTLVQWDALRHLQAHPGASLHDLAVLTFQTDQAFGTLAARLEARGLIRRVKGTGRAIRPELTPEGERVFAEGREVTERVVRESFAPLDADERAVFGGMLERLLADETATNSRAKTSPPG
jgi:DNA-binding MarR family transcriptional regulator